jgi:hypothetical protein
MRFGTRNIRSLYRAGSLMTATRESAIYKLDIIIFYMGKEMKIINWEQGFLYITD